MEIMIEILLYKKVMDDQLSLNRLSMIWHIKLGSANETRKILVYEKNNAILNIKPHFMHIYNRIKYWHKTNKRI